MAEKIEFDLTVNGKKAKKSIEDVEKAQEELGKTTKSTTKDMESNWVSLGAKIAATAVTFGALIKAGADNDKMMFGLNQRTREYIKLASQQYGETQNIIASYVQTGKAAGMSGDQIKAMIDQAIALGRLYPNESTESFIDNLTMLNTTGEAQGYIVDILEQKWGAIDLKGKSLAEKMAVIEEKTAGVNKEFGNLDGAKVDKALTEVMASFTDLGKVVLGLLSDSGAFTALSKGLGFLKATMSGLAIATGYVKIGIKGIFGQDTQEDIKNQTDLIKANNKAWSDLFNTKGKDLPAPSKEDSLGIEQTSNRKDQYSLEVTKKAEEEKLKEIEKAKQIEAELRKKFDDDFVRSITSNTEYELLQLQKQYDEYSKVVGNKIKLNEWYSNEKKNILEKSKEDEKLINEEIQGYFKDTFSTKLTDSLLEGKASFKDFANSIITDIARIIIQKQIANAISGAMSGGFFAQGGVIGGESPVQKRFATGGVVTRPTRLASGGLVGERNRAEAVLPLERTANGDLGVKSAGGKGGVVINIENNSGVPIEAENIMSGGNKEQETINIVLSGINKNTNGIRDMLKGMK